MNSKPYDLSELIKRWEREQITTEQAIGQILLWLVALVEQMAKIEVNNRKVNNNLQ